MDEKIDRMMRIIDEKTTAQDIRAIREMCTQDNHRKNSSDHKENR
jgi:hypothetical protein